MDVKFDLTGVNRIEAVLRELGPQVAGRVAQTALRAGAEPIVEEARRLVPKRSGALRDSITVAAARTRGEERNHSRTVHIGFLPPASRRAHLIEYGTSKMSAQPFMRPAMDSKAPVALTEMSKSLARGMANAAARLAKKK